MAPRPRGRSGSSPSRRAGGAPGRPGTAAARREWSPSTKSRSSAALPVSPSASAASTASTTPCFTDWKVVPRMRAASIVAVPAEIASSWRPSPRLSAAVAESHVQRFWRSVECSSRANIEWIRRASSSSPRWTCTSTPDSSRLSTTPPASTCSCVKSSAVAKHLVPAAEHPATDRSRSAAAQPTRTAGCRPPGQGERLVEVGEHLRYRRSSREAAVREDEVAGAAPRSLRSCSSARSSACFSQGAAPPARVPG